MQLFAVIALWTLLYNRGLYSYIQKLFLFFNYITNVLISQTERQAQTSLPCWNKYISRSEYKKSCTQLSLWKGC